MHFHQWSLWHVSIVFLTACGTVLFSLIARRDASGSYKYIIGNSLGTIQVLNYAVYTIYLLRVGDWDLKYDLPMELCNWAAAVTVIALFTRNRLFSELSYFWVMGGSLQGVLTPDLNVGFPHITFFFFFIAHSGLVIASGYAVFGLQLYPREGSFWRAFWATQFYLLSAFSVNLALDANYGYLMRKPVSGSLLDYMGDWPYYILSAEVVGVVLVSGLYLPFYAYNRRSKIFKR